VPVYRGGLPFNQTLNQHLLARLPTGKLGEGCRLAPFLKEGAGRGRVEWIGKAFFLFRFTDVDGRRIDYGDRNVFGTLAEDKRQFHRFLVNGPWRRTSSLNSVSSVEH